jgi:putative endonuclease
MSSIKGARRQTGALGESAAVRHLSNLGYRILERNFRCSWGEIDIVAEDAGGVVFVEVRTRTNSAASLSYGSPEESITEAKAERMVRCAHAYIAERSIGGAWRIDLIAIQLSLGKVQRLEHYQHALH